MSTSSLPAQEPDNQGNQNLHLTDSLLVFGFGSERLTAKSYGSTPFFAAARSFQPMSAAACTGCTEALTPSFRGENCSFYLFEGMGSFSLIGSGSGAAQPQGAWHPAVFNMIGSWISDTESPVVTEVNLDAVQRNRNQFDRDEVKQEGEWIVNRVRERGFTRYRVIERKDNYYKVEYQDNGGGTLTTSSQIGFTLERREILVGGRPKVINTLRVISYSE